MDKSIEIGKINKSQAAWVPQNESFDQHDTELMNMPEEDIEDDPEGQNILK